MSLQTELSEKEVETPRGRGSGEKTAEDTVSGWALVLVGSRNLKRSVRSAAACRTRPQRV